MSVIIYSNMFNVIILKRSVRFSIKIIKVWYYICKRSSIHSHSGLKCGVMKPL